MIWTEWLEDHKRKSTQDFLLLLSRQHSFQQLCIGWRNSRVTFPHDDPVPPNVADLKAAAWGFSQYCVGEVAVKSSIPLIGGIKELIIRAASLDMIYPDGTINDAATKLLSGIIAKEIKVAVR